MTHFRTRRIFTSALYAATAAAALWAISPAYAGLLTQNYSVDFSAATQSFWGPGQSSASFGYSYFTGSSNVGVGFQTGASTGTVSATYNGSVSVSYNNAATEGNVPVTIGYSGAGSYSTLLGAYAYAYADLLGHKFTITNPNYSLNTGGALTHSPLDTATGTDSFTPASTSIGPKIGVGPIDVYSTQAGINYNIVQNSQLAVSALTGIATATNQTSGDVRTAPFSFGSSDTINLNLNETGLWDVALSNLALSNLFSTNFNLAFQPYAEYSLGPNCDPLNPKNNGFGCIADGGVSKTIASFQFYHNNPFALDFGTNYVPSTFQIDVAAPTTPVPEPSTLSVLGFGLVALFAVRRRYLRRKRA